MKLMAIKVASREAARTILLVLAGAMPAVVPAPAAAAMLTGQFVGSQVTDGRLIATDGNTFYIEGKAHPVPAELKPTAAFTFSRTPSERVLYSLRSTGTSGCSGSVVSFHRIPATAGQPLEPIVSSLCLPGGIAWERFYDRQLSSSQQIAVIAERLGQTATQQNVHFVDLERGSVTRTSFDADLEDPGRLEFGPSGTVALVRYDTDDGDDGIGAADYRLVDLCPGSVGVSLATWRDLGGLMTGEVVGDVGEFAARLRHQNLPGGADDVPLADCLGSPPPVPPGSLLVTLRGTGSGTVDSTPAGISCPGDCDETYTAGATVTLTATPDAGSMFLHWTGDCSGSNPTVGLELAAGMVCGAEFRRLSTDLSVSLSGSYHTAEAGQLFFYTQEARNSGPHAATGVVLRFTVPAGAVFRSALDCTHQSGEVTCWVGDLAPAATKTRLVLVEVLPDTRAGLVGRTEVSGSEFDPVAANNTATVTTAVTAEAGLSITKTVGPEPAPPGGVVAYQVMVHNAGPSSATAVTVTDALPAGLKPLHPSGSASLTCATGTLAPGGRRRVTILARVEDDATPGSELVNEASVTAAEADPDATDNSARATKTVSPATPRDPSRLTRIADQATAIPDGSGTFFNTGTPAVSGGTVAFRGGNRDAHTGAYRWTDGVLSTVADLATTPPDGSSSFSHLRSLSLDGLDVTFAADARPARDGAQNGVYTSDACTQRMVVNQSTALPGLGDTRATRVYGATAYDGTVAYSGLAYGRSGIRLWDRGTITTLVDGDTLVPGTMGGFASFAAQPDYDGETVVFRAADKELHEGIYAWVRRTQELIVVADRNTPVPGGAGTFTGVSDRPSVDAGRIVFTGFSGDTAGIYRYDLQSRSLTVVVDTTTPVPGRSETFRSFSSGPAVDGGRIAFVGGPSGKRDMHYMWEDEGVYLYENGSLRTVIAPGDSLDGRVPEAFMLGAQGLSGQRLAFVATFLDEKGYHRPSIYLARLDVAADSPTASAGEGTGATGGAGGAGGDTAAEPSAATPTARAVTGLLDRRPPSLTAVRARLRGDGRRLAVRVTADEPARLELVLRGPGRRRLSRTVTRLRKRGVRTVTLRLNTRARTAARTAGARLALAITATDAAGNRRSLTVSVKRAP